MSTPIGNRGAVSLSCKANGSQSAVPTSHQLHRRHSDRPACIRLVGARVGHQARLVISCPGNNRAFASEVWLLCSVCSGAVGLEPGFRFRWVSHVVTLAVG